MTHPLSWHTIIDMLAPHIHIIIQMCGTLEWWHCEHGQVMVIVHVEETVHFLYIVYVSSCQICVTDATIRQINTCRVSRALCLFRGVFNSSLTDRFCDVSLDDCLAIDHHCIMILSLLWAMYRESYREFLTPTLTHYIICELSNISYQFNSQSVKWTISQLNTLSGFAATA